MMPWLNLVGWLVCIVYATIPAFWLVVHPRVEYWRSRTRSPYRTLLPMWVGMWIVLALVTAPWRRVRLYDQPWSWIPPIGLFAVGLWVYSQSGKQFSRAQLGGLPEVLPAHREQRLVTSGIRSRVRHPVYLAHFCEMLGWSIGTGLLVLFGLTVFALITGAIMIRLEDEELDRRFGEEYREYQRAVPAVLPRL